MKRMRRLLLSGVLFLGQMSCSSLNGLEEQGRNKKMISDYSAVLRTSQDPVELLNTALLLCQTQQQAAYGEILNHLQQEEFLNRLDSEQEYLEAPKKLRLWRILEALKTSADAGAHQALKALTQAPGFSKNPARIELLIEACSAVRPAPPEVIQFWGVHCQPSDGYLHVTMEAILDNGSPPALALFEGKMMDARFSHEDKTAWMLSSVLMHRNQAQLLHSCRRLLNGSLAEPLRPTLVEALFDYKPQEWFTPATALTPEYRGKASTEALLLLRDIGQMALGMRELNASQKAAVQKTLLEVEAILASRKKS
ncbi:MAG: hypothetical protein L0312_14375 [Acidobacteria bacterium]|nr:hypothetical protein [Acidobacteriota bacterium]